MSNIVVLLGQIDKKKLLFQHNIHKIECIANRASFYIGIDPTAPNIHIGHLINMELVRIMSKLFTPIVMIGTFTAMIGDPSFRSKHRELITKECIHSNATSITSVLTTICKNMNIDNVIFVNNSYLGHMNIEEYMRIASYFNIRNMLSSKVFTNRKHGAMYLNEFVYSTLQAIDYYNMYRKHNCIIQIGGQDQWYNIVSGIKLINDIEQVNTYAITVPLIVDANGQKIGKTNTGCQFSLAINNGHYYIYNVVITWPRYIIEYLCTVFEIITSDNSSHSIALHIVRLLFSAKHVEHIVTNMSYNGQHDELTPRHSASYKEVMKYVYVNYNSKQFEAALQSSNLTVNGTCVSNINEYYNAIVSHKNYIEYKQQFYCFIKI